MLKQYPALLYKDAGSDFVVLFPDLPGCVSAAGTVEEALAGAREAAQRHIDCLIEDGAPIPDAGDLEQAALKARTEAGFLSVALIPARIPGRAKRVQITLDEHLLSDVDNAASESGMTRSGWLATLARAHLAHAE